MEVAIREIEIASVKSDKAVSVASSNLEQLRLAQALRKKQQERADQEALLRKQQEEE